MLRTHLCALGETTADELRWSRGDPACPCLEITPVGPPELAVVGRLLGAGDEQPILDGFRLLAGESQEPPWVIGLPEVLRDLLASLDERSLPRHAAEWAAATPRLAPAAAVTILRGMRALAATGSGPLALHVTGRR